MPEVLRTYGLSKSFGNTRVVDDLSIHVNQGEIFGFLGVNGAGKTTTIGMMLGMIRPTGGGITMLGKKMSPVFDLWSQIGYQVGSNDSYPNLSVDENLRIVCRYRRIKGHSSIDEIVARLNLTKFRKKKAGELSLGNLQRLSLAKALIHKPKLLILDEPTNGLDPAAIVEVRKIIKELAEQGSSVFMSSHILSEVSHLANRIAIIHDGRLINEIATDDLGRLLRQTCLVDTTDNVRGLNVLKDHGFGAEISASGLIQVLDEAAVEHPERISTVIFTAGLAIKELWVEKEDLESFFLRSISQP